ncbi:MAG TPA: glycosyltransferase family 2 protein [Chthoniobacterales bacterium]|jgi:glycosyltransferase involved in cell wall biosynthesis|nr:glycosyltransferase family 2 protein [Chthoniobacterales bacterium]
MIELTALILAFNERENIGRTLTALSWVKQIVIVDSFSTDETIEIAKAMHLNITVVQRQFDAHATQWNFGLAQIRTMWVLTLDAHYELSRELSNEIAELKPSDEVSAYHARFQFRIFGANLRASAYPPRPILLRTERCTYYDAGHTQKLAIEGLTPDLSGVVYHDDRKPLSGWLRAQDRYATIEGRYLLATLVAQLNFQDRLRPKIVLAAPLMFFYLLFARGLLLDGWPGWFYVCQRTIAESLLSIRLLIEREKLEGKN